MCGIAITIGDQWSPHERARFLDRAISALEHRGPDATGRFMNGPVAMAHTRLKIIDLSDRANQPFRNSRYVLVFNGEIFNYKELRQELEDEFEFVTTSDTEVLFYSLVRWGRMAVEKFDGQFAFAFYDTDVGDLLLARDRFGICPLYYVEHHDQLFFASEIKPLLEIAGRKLDPQAAWDYFRFRFAIGQQTMFSGIKRFPPGHLAMVNTNRPAINWSTYAQFPDAIPNPEPDSFENALTVAVQKQTVADVPLGIYLSGGIDSTAVMRAACKWKTNLHSFTLQFDAGDTDDVERVNNLAGSLPFSPHIVQFRHNTVANLTRAVDALEDLFGDLIILANYQLAAVASKHLKVALSGEGGDEIFFGYEHQQKLRKLNSMNVFSPAITHLCKMLPASWLARTFSYPGVFGKHEQNRVLRIAGQISNPLRCYCSAVSVFTEDELESYFTEDFRNRIDPTRIPEGLTTIFDSEETLEDAVYRADIEQVLLPINLTKQDRFSMRHSMESRVPLLDNDIFSYAAALPRSVLYSPNSKDCLRKYGAGHGHSVIKKPFSLLGSSFYLELIRELSDRYLRSDNPYAEAMFDVASVRQLMTPAFRQEVLPMKKLMCVLMFLVWCEVFELTCFELNN